MGNGQYHEFAGLRRELEVGLRVAPTAAGTVAAAKALASYLDAAPGVPVRLAGIGREGSRVHFIIAVCLGSIDEIKVGDPRSRAAVVMIQQMVDGLAAYDPAFVTLPEPLSCEASLAARVTSRPTSATADMLTAARRLAAVA